MPFVWVSLGRLVFFFVFFVGNEKKLLYLLIHYIEYHLYIILLYRIFFYYIDTSTVGNFVFFVSFDQRCRKIYI